MLVVLILFASTRDKLFKHVNVFGYCSMACDMCGSENSPFKVRVEGTVMSVCGGCKNYGEQIREPKRKVHVQRRSQPSTEKFLMISSDFSSKIKNARESRGLKQEELAKKLHIKESQLHSFESNHHKPDIETARRIEKELGITFVEEYVEEHESVRTKQSGPLTIADMIKRK